MYMCVLSKYLLLNNYFYHMKMKYDDVIKNLITK